MHVRVARFEDVDVGQIEENYAEFRKMLRSEERPEWMPEEVFATLREKVRRVVSLADRDAGVTLDMTFTDSAEDARSVHEALDSLNPPDMVGRRSSAEIFELVLDEQL